MENSFINTNIDTGLSEKEVHKRQLQFGKNVLSEKGKFAIFIDFLKTLFSPLILLLIGASLLSAFLGDIKDFFIIFGIIVVSGTVTFFQHFKAEHTAQKLKQKVLLSATVLRDGKEKEIPFSGVTIGDIVHLEVGDIIPADLQLLSSKECSVDESTLTGESFPVEKTPENKNLFMGTHILSGEGVAVVTQIGKDTRFGKLSKEILEAKPSTSFDKGINSFAILILKTVVVMAFFVFGVNTLFHHNILEALLFAVALAVGITPELLPVILTINLARGAITMEKQEVIVKYLPSIQNLGAMNILCTDKTGTLTENAVNLENSSDSFGEKNFEALQFALIASSFQSGFKNPLDNAILKHKETASISQYEKVDEIPFDFTRKTISVIVRSKKNKNTLLIAKGSPYNVLHHVTHYKKGSKNLLLTGKEKKKLDAYFQRLSHEGFRLIAVAIKDIHEKKSFTVTDEENLTLIGFLTFSDPVKNTVKKTLDELEALGVSIKILTGDNEYVSEHVCKSVGLPTNKIILGEELEKIPTNELVKIVRETTVFARLTPAHKARIIDVLRADNSVVGYLGDGINDAPPLKSADVGISVNNGSDIAREVADIVLMRKSLEVLKSGVIEGRKTHVNILKYIQMEISSNFGNMVTVAIASFFLPFLPLLPIQILLNNFLYDFSQITIPSDTVDEELIISPLRWDINFVKRFMITFGSISSVFDFITFFILLGILHVSSQMFRTGWFAESLLTQTLIIFSIRTKKFPFFKSKPSILIVISSLLVIFAGLFLIVGPFAKIFDFTRLPILFYALLLIIMVSYFGIVEVAKKMFYRV